MNILHIVSSAASGGAEVYVKDMSKKMTDAGHNVFIAFLDRSSETGRDSQFESSFLQELDDYGVQYKFLGKHCRKNLLMGAYKIFKICKSFKADVIHSHLYYGALFSLPQFNVRHVYTHHNIKLKASPFIYKLLDLRTSAYVGICGACEDMLSSVSKRRIVRIDNGVDAERLIQKQDYFPQDPLSVICVGTLSQQKNHELLINSVFRNKDLPIHVSIVGEGPRRKELEELVVRLGIADRVEFLGNSSEVNKLLSTSDIFVMSSKWEGLPIAQIEATLTGLPVLVTNVGGCPEIVESVGNGLVAEVTIDDFSEKFRKIVIDSEFRGQCHKNAISESGVYTVDAATYKHLSLYSEVAGDLL
ncbi:glycosyltransferase [Halomonas mongoliensis]|uniref:glycosyltransferase n=1 Tax=Halomonas mongoliensis TaxID=321265 RepID=UPI00403ADD77